MTGHPTNCSELAQTAFLLACLNHLIFLTYDRPNPCSNWPAFIFMRHTFCLIFCHFLVILYSIMASLVLSKHFFLCFPILFCTCICFCCLRCYGWLAGCFIIWHWLRYELASNMPVFIITHLIQDCNLLN